MGIQVCSNKGDGPF